MTYQSFPLYSRSFHHRFSNEHFDIGRNFQENYQKIDFWMNEENLSGNFSYCIVNCFSLRSEFSLITENPGFLQLCFHVFLSLILKPLQFLSHCFLWGHLNGNITLLFFSRTTTTTTSVHCIFIWCNKKVKAYQKFTDSLPMKICDPKMSMFG